MGNAQIRKFVSPGKIKLASLRFAKGKKILLDSGTHLGRSLTLGQGTPRAIPNVVELCRTSLYFPQVFISRNHALLLFEDGTWNIYDLDSLNGTFVNDEKVGSWTPKPLKHEDTISLGPGFRFTFCSDEKTESIALLIGNPGIPYLQGTWNDLEIMRKTMASRGYYDDHRTILFDTEATRKRIFESLEAIAEIMTVHSHFLFYFCGHGSKNGIHAFDGTITPEEIYSKLRNMRGKNLVILDSCHSSFFLNDIPPRTLVVSGESPEGTLYDGVVTNLSDSGRFRAGYLTHAFVQLIEKMQGEFDLKEIADQLGNHYKLRKHDVEAIVDGVEFTIPSEV